jgi:hypothetical protein
MDDQLVPRALSILRDSKNPAADAALLAALPLMSGSARDAAIDLLVHRGHTPSLAGLLALFLKGDQVLRKVILGRIAVLHGPLRAALDSSTLEARAGALEAIAVADEWPLSYAVADALQSKCLRTRELAAATLGTLVESLLVQGDAERPWQSTLATSPSRIASKPSTTPGDASDAEQAGALADAASQALRTWELHHQPRALEAALRLGQLIVPALKHKLEERSTRIARAISDFLSGTRDPRLAEFVMCALPFPELRQSALSVLHSCRDPVFMDAVIRSSWLLDDPEIASGFRRVRQCPWLHESVDFLAHLDFERAARAIRLLLAGGGSHERKLDQLRSLITAGEEPIHRAILDAVMDDSSPAANSVLNLLASRARGATARAAADELKRREFGVAQMGGAAVEGDDPAAMRAALRSSNALDRLRALTMIREKKLTGEFAEQVHHAAHDADPTIRSLAVAMLVDLPGATTLRILRAASEDADGRVQANAIETLDRLNVSQRASSTQPKLNARNNRVRANAVHSLLRLELREAGHALLDMLQDPSPAHRISALWVIERLGLSPVRMRIEELGQSDPDPRVRERARRLSSTLSQSDSWPIPPGQPPEADGLGRQRGEGEDAGESPTSRQTKQERDEPEGACRSSPRSRPVKATRSTDWEAGT